jgi:DNA-binding Lrp family transcriptional regulator
MIKKFNEFIREFVDNTDSVLDAKMQEIKELVDSIGGQAFMYEWENKNDHELFVNFTNNELILRYEFDIDDLMLKKIASNVVDFETAVSSIDEGLDIIEKDIHSILGVSETYQGRWSESLKSEDVKQIYPMVKRILEIYPGESADQEGIVEELERKLSSYDDIVREYIIDTLMFGDPDISFDELERKVIDLGDRIYDMGTERRMVIDAFEAAFEVIGKHFYLTESKYEENISIIIEAGEGNAFIKNRYINLEINRKLMKILNNEFNLNFNELSEKNKIENSKVSEISDFLCKIGLHKNESKLDGRVRLAFSGKLTLKDIKKLK